MSLTLDDFKHIKEALAKAAIRDSMVTAINRATTIVHTKDTVMIERLKREKDRLELALAIARERLHFGSPEEITDRHDKLRKEINTLKSKMEACDRLIRVNRRKLAKE